MLQSVKLKNFKCFHEQCFPFTNLTILAGLNGMGKSSLLQSLLLLRQSESTLNRGVNLKGSYVNLGSIRDVLYEAAEDDSLSISITENGRVIDYQFDCSDSYSDFLPLSKRQTEVERHNIFSNRFTYLSAYRIAPQSLYNITNNDVLEQHDFGANGEYAIQYLKEHTDDIVSCKNTISATPSLGLEVQAWMNKISPGVSPIITINLQTRAAELNYEFIQGKYKTMTYKSMNVGFGITYVLPVIVSLLSANPGDLLLLENPEAHIHPKGQRYLGELIAKVAASGVQILLETHSDHVLNGVRLSARNHTIDVDDVTLTFFTVDYSSSGDYKRQIVWPKLLQNGQIDQWPDGFFDEWDNVLLELL